MESSSVMSRGEDSGEEEGEVVGDDDDLGEPRKNKQQDRTHLQVREKEI